MQEQLSLAAPGFDPGAQGLPWYRMVLSQNRVYLLSVFFLTIPLIYGVGTAPWRYAALVACCLSTATFYLGTVLVTGWGFWARTAWLGAMTVSVVGVSVVAADLGPLGYYSTYVLVAAALLLPWRMSRYLIVVVGVGGIVAGMNTEAAPMPAIMAATGTVVALSIAQGLENRRITAALDRAEQRTAVLAVAAERERIGRDLHDILGHSLTAIAVRADLAARLVDRDSARAVTEIEALAAIARQALADVRATASGMREVRLATEVAAARSVLGAAGIECRAPNAIGALSDADSELLGYVVREAVTNVVRHSGANVCVLTLDQDATGHTRLAVSDDGKGFTGRRGGGLTGLAQRVEEAGGELELDGDARGTRLEVTLPGSARDSGSRSLSRVDATPPTMTSTPEGER